MPQPKKWFCTFCNSETHDDDDAYTRYCRSCDRFAYEFGNPHTRSLAEPVQLDLIIGAIQRNKYRPSINTLVEFGLDPVIDPKDGFMCWRAYVKVNGIVKEHSRKFQHSPQDAFRELYHRCLDTGVEDG